MRAALFPAFNAPLTVTEVAEPACPPDGAVVSVAACGVCRSDWHAWKGADPDVAAPHVPGHEFAGTVVAVGSDCRRIRVGQRVTAPFILACGACADCLGGDATLCADQHVMGFSAYGAFAERVAVPHGDFNLVPLPDDLPETVAAAMGCRLTTAFRALTERAPPAPGDWVAVHGAGGVGLAAVMIAAALGARVVAVDIRPPALELARQLGAEATIDASVLARGPDGEPAAVGEAVRETTGGGARVSLDALGITATFEASLFGLARGGRHVQLGMPLGPHATPRLPLLELVYARQIAILGSRGVAASRFPSLLGMVAAGRIDPGRLITRRIPLEEAGAALAAMDSYAATGITVIDRF